MTITVDCGSCGRMIRVKDEYAGRRIRCPDCESPVSVPAEDDEFEDYEAEAPKVSESSAPGRRRGKSKAAGQKSGRGGSSWYGRQWHWIAVAVMMILAAMGKPGLALALLIAGVGVVLILIGGIVPFFRVFFKAPGSVLLMIVSRSARFDMMRRPDNDPYKRLIHESFDSMRGTFWRGVLLVAAMIPAMFVHGATLNLWKGGGGNQPVANRPPMPHLRNAPGRVAPGGARQQAPLGQPGPAPSGDAAAPNTESSTETPQADSSSSDPPQGDASSGPRSFAARGGRPGTNRGADPAADRLFYNLLKFESGQVQTKATPEEVLKSALSEMPEYVADTLSVDESAGEAKFQTRGRINSLNLARALSQHGYRARGFRNSTNPIK